MKTLVTDYNLETTFDCINLIYFDNKLKRNFKLGFTNTKKSTGYVDSVKDKRTNEIHIDKLNISDVYLKTKEEFLSVFIHEMIHVKMIQNRFFEENHGDMFIAEMKRLNDLLKNSYDGVKIEIKDYNIDKVNPKRNFNLVAVTALDSNDNYVCTNFVKERYFNNNFAEIMLKGNNTTGYSFKWKIITLEDIVMLNVPISKTLGSGTIGYKLNDEYKEKFIANSEIF